MRILSKNNVFELKINKMRELQAAMLYLKEDAKLDKKFYSHVILLVIINRYEFNKEKIDIIRSFSYH